MSDENKEWYLNIDYREAKEIIRNKLQGMTQNFIGIGFYLRQIKETEGFQKDGYVSVYEFAEDQYGIKRSTAIRWMQMNEKFSQGGYSPFLDSGYKDFGKSQLQEMLYLDSEQLEEVTPEMTVREIREIRTPDLEPEEEEEQLPGQMSVEDFPEVLPEQAEEKQTAETKVELQKPTKEQREYLNAFARRFIVIRRNWFREDYQNRVLNVETSPVLIRQEFCEGKDRTYYFEIGEETASINLFDDYIQLWSEDHEYMGDFDWFYLAAAIQSMWNVVAIEEARQKNEEEQTSEEVCDVAQPVENTSTDSQLKQSSCPSGQTSCPRENWGTSDEDQLQGWRECAACWNHYKKLHEHDEVGIEIPQDIMEEVTEPVEVYREIPEENEPVIIEQPEGITIVDAPSEPETKEVSEKTDIDIAREENQKAQMYLEMAEKEFGQNDIRVRKQKILVAALAGYIHDLDMLLNPPEEPEQPELPLFRNNDQRKEWLRNYKDWGIWYTDEHIGCTYYKYDFENGARLIAEEYESQYTDYVSYLHLINGPKSPRGKYGQTKWTMYKQYNKYPNSESELVEFLKWIQKGDK